MIEAWKLEHRPLLYAIVRRYELVRWALRVKQFATQRARLRAVLLVLRGHETEICQECGGAVGVVWWCGDDALWEQVTGEQGGGGICCVHCFNRMAERKGIYLRWHVGLL